MNKFLNLILLFSFILGNLGCDFQESNNLNQAHMTENKLLGIAITHSANEKFENAFAEVQKIGINFTSLPINWDDVEKSPEKYSPEPNFLKIANAFYPANKIKIALELNPIDTVKTRMPSDLSNKKFDDPEVINRFKAFVEWSFKQIPDLDLVSLSIGNEIDVYLANDSEKWKQYQTFFKETSNHAKKLKPNLKIGTKITYNGLSGGTANLAKSTNSEADAILTTYYHLNNDFTAKDPKAIKEVFENSIKLYSDKEIYFLEIGMPSGESCKSSEQKQAEFITETFENWDKYANQIKLLNFTWLTDISKKDTDYFETYYGLSNKCFLEFLATLGMRTADGKAKLALKRLKQEVEKRKMVK